MTKIRIYFKLYSFWGGCNEYDFKSMFAFVQFPKTYSRISVV